MSDSDECATLCEPRRALQSVALALCPPGVLRGDGRAIIRLFLKALAERSAFSTRLLRPAVAPQTISRYRLFIQYFQFRL